jgi:hypothetical protein
MFSEHLPISYVPQNGIYDLLHTFTRVLFVHSFVGLYSTAPRNTCVLYRFFAMDESRSCCPFTFRYILSYSWMLCLFYLFILSTKCIFNCCGSYSYIYIYIYFPPWQTSPQLARASSLSRLDDHTALSVGLLWASDEPNADNSTWQHTTLTTERHTCHRRHSNPQSQQASGHRPTP